MRLLARPPQSRAARAASGHWKAEDGRQPAASHCEAGTLTRRQETAGSLQQLSWTQYTHTHTHGSSNKSPATCGISSEIMMNALSMPDINYVDFKVGFSQFTLITSSVNECDAFSILCRYPPSDNSLAEL